VFSITVIGNSAWALCGKRARPFRSMPDKIVYGKSVMGRYLRQPLPWRRAA
jgi:hypothetical protein